MYYFQQFKSALTTAQLRVLSSRFESLDSVRDLAVLLKKESPALMKMAETPSYHEFYIPKPGGEKRFIQHPAPTLKVVQQELNRYLQAVYYGIRPPCVHGFVVSPGDEPQPRNIYTNALAHARGHWFLNIDLKDFFHTVTAQHVYDLWRNIFWFPEHLSTLLSCLCCYGGRLPMGAPTSPVLSNLVFYQLDGQLLHLARSAEAIYTRYADDLTFSFPRPPAEDFTDQVRHLLLTHGFTVNEKKVRLQGRLEQPEVTGLVVGKGAKPVLSKSYLKTLKKEVAIYRWLISETVQERGFFQHWLFEQFRQSIAGQVEFAGFVLGKGDRMYQRLVGKLRWG